MAEYRPEALFAKSIGKRVSGSSCSSPVGPETPEPNPFPALPCSPVTLFQSGTNEVPLFTSIHLLVVL